MTAAPNRRHRRELALAVLAMATPSAVALTATDGPLQPLGLAVSAAHAGTYKVNYCGPDGVAENWAEYATAPGTSGNSCGPPGGRLNANLPQNPWGEGSIASILFTAPDNTTIAGWNPTLRFTAAKTTENTERMEFRAGAGAPNGAGSYPVGCTNLACPPVISDVPITPGARQLSAFVFCARERDDFDICHFTVDVTDNGGTVTLQDDSSPTARGGVSGSLANATSPPNAASGARDLHVLVDDTGSGVASVRLEIDGTPVGTGPSCAAQPTTKVVPCPLSQNGNIVVDTTKIADGRHSAKIVATDASGNTSVLWDQTIYVANTPIGPGSPAELRGDASVAGATDDARVTASWPSTAKRPSKKCKSKTYRRRHRAACKSRPASSTWRGRYARKSGVTVTGRVTNKTTKAPIPGAPVVLTATPIRPGSTTITMRGTANANGRYTFKLPKDQGAHSVKIGFLSRQYDVRPAAQGSARQLVRSTTKIAVSRKSARRGQSVKFSTALRDGTAGVPMVVEVYANKKWRVFAAGSSKAKGRFQSRFKFIGPGSYRFRARARPTKSTPWPYLGGTSRVVRVRVR